MILAIEMQSPGDCISMAKIELGEQEEGALKSERREMFLAFLRLSP